ncbi:MAG: VOC family protein [Gammaproteobacteria bacterium]|nr:VOC family protein [Gammaproteobacteria bacterium]MDH5803181.1 VOC family protein [Gammaproteobacteria bacterium]
MTRLEHVNLVSRDMNATLAFLQVAFPDWKIRGRGQNEWYGVKREWLHFGTDDFYITLNEGSQEDNRDLKGHSPGLAHIGIVVDDLNAVVERLESQGHEISMQGAEHPYRKNVYFEEASGFEFEFVQYLSESSEKRNMYGGET